MKNLDDVAGVRVICSFIDDIYEVVEMLARQDDVKVIAIKDYIGLSLIHIFLLVRTPKTPRDLHSIASYLFMREGDNECVYQFKAKHLKITSPESVDWTLDGEFGGSVAEVEIRCV